MATDQVITLPPDSTGKSVDMSQVVTSADVKVQRERVNLSDPSDPNALVSVRGEQGSGYSLAHDREVRDLLQSIDSKLEALLGLLIQLVND